MKATEKSLHQLVQTQGATSKARRQYVLVLDALKGLEQLEEAGELKGTGVAVLNLLRAATDNTEEVLK